MQILVYNRRRTAPNMVELAYPYVSLFQDNWDDFGFRARFIASLHLSEDEEIQLGPMKIGTGRRGFRAEDTPMLLEALPGRSASLGESIAYYRKLSLQPAPLRRRYLSLMRDVIAKPERRRNIQNEDLWNNSFMREASSRHALKRGGYYIGAPFDQAEPLDFSFEMTVPAATDAHRIDLDFTGQQGLPNRTILFIGRNGTGKTKALASLAASAIPRNNFEPTSLEGIPRGNVRPDIDISRLIAVSYNAFDNFPLPSARRRCGVTTLES